MPSLVDRIRWVVDSGRMKSNSAWCVQAGLPRTYLGRYFHQARHAEASDMGLNTAAALAKAAGVSPAWLAYGMGSPEDVAATLPPQLAALVARLPKSTYPAKLVEQAAFVRDLIGQKDLSEELWRDYLDGLRREARRLALEVAGTAIEELGLKR